MYVFVFVAVHSNIYNAHFVAEQIYNYKLCVSLLSSSLLCRSDIGLLISVSHVFFCVLREWWWKIAINVQMCGVLRPVNVLSTLE